MQGLTSLDVTTLLFALGCLLGTARLLGEIAQRFHQPTVLGELLAGVLLGPTVFGTIAPQLSTSIFPVTGPVAVALDAVATLALVLFLLVAGLEVDLSTAWRQGRLALKVGLAGVLVPFGIGMVAALALPNVLGRMADADPRVFALFFATALSISALPVIAKTLMDLDIYRSDLGMVVVSAAVFNDLIGWTVFAVILGSIEARPGRHLPLPLTILFTLIFAVLMLTVGRTIVHRILPPLQAYTHWPGGVLSFAMVLALFGGALTEWIGIHAIFGSFLVGVAIGDSAHLRERTRVTIDQFVSFIFAPVFFASIGLKVNFLTQFNVSLVLFVLLIACLGKLAGATLGARWGGMFPRDAWAVGFAMNARGAMEIILGLLALETGIIHQELFVALVVMALVTSMVSGPAMRYLLCLKKPRKLVSFLSPKLYLRSMQAISRQEAVEELARAIGSVVTTLDVVSITSVVWAREEIVSTGIGNGVALPHARIAGLTQPVVAVGLSRSGIDFDSPDGGRAHVIFLILTPADTPGIQLEIAAQIAHLFRDHSLVEQTLRTSSFAEFLVLVKAAGM